MKESRWGFINKSGMPLGIRSCVQYGPLLRARWRHRGSVRVVC